MSKFQNYLKKFDIAATVTDEEMEKTMALLQLYVPTLRRAARGIDEFEEECYESRRQSVSDFINLAVDYDRDTDRKRIAERLVEMGHSMQFLSILEDALLLVKDDPTHGQRYYEILRARYFDAYCRSNEDAYLALGISSATYYRNIKPAIRLLAANLWCIVIPDLIIDEKRREAERVNCAAFSADESQMREYMRVTQLFAWILKNVDGYLNSYAQFLCSKNPDIICPTDVGEFPLISTQETLPVGRIDLFIRLNEHTSFICEHKVHSELSHNQIQKYMDSSHLLGGGNYYSVLVTYSTIQHTQKADLLLLH